MGVFKHLDIDALPEGWDAAHFRDLTDYALGRTPPRNDASYWKDGTYPWVSISDMEPFGVVTDTAEQVTEKAFEQVFRGQLVPEGSLLMSFKLTIGRIARLGIPALHNEAIISFVPVREKVDDRYLAYYLSQINYSDYQDKAIKGHTLNKGKIDALEIALPPLPEQQRIAQVLSTVQEAIAQQERLIRTTTELKQALMQKLFTEGLRGEALKETEIGRVPESWEVVPLGSLVDFSQGKQVPLEDQQLLPEPGLTRFLRIVDYTQRTTDWRFVKVDSDKYTVRPEDIIMVRYGAVFVGTGLAGVLANNMFKIEPKSKILDKSFLYYLLSRETIVAHLQSSMMGAGMPALNFGMLRGIMVPLPRTEEQIDLAISLKRFDQKITLIDRKKSSLQDLFRTLLHELMTGKVRVGDKALANA